MEELEKELEESALLEDSLRADIKRAERETERQRYSSWSVVKCIAGVFSFSARKRASLMASSFLLCAGMR